MTTKHKIKLIFSRINWWLSFTKEAKQYADNAKRFKNIKEIQKDIYNQYLKSHREDPLSSKTERLKTKLLIIKEILNGR